MTMSSMGIPAPLPLGERGSKPRSQALPGNALPGRLRLPSVPVGNHLEQSVASLVIHRARVEPMHRIGYVPAPQRIIVHILEFLQHHVVASNLLRMAALLPQLMSLISLVMQLEEA